MEKLTEEQLRVLKQYADTNDGRFLQEIPGAHELWRPMGLLEWRGSSFGTNFYSITDAGRAALSKAEGGEGQDK